MHKIIKQVSFRGIKIHYSDQGKGRVLVLLHGFLESIEIFEIFSSALSKNCRVICIDLLGHGKTATMGYIHSMELMAECVKFVLDALPIKKCVIVGHSMGGYVALAFAQAYPNFLAGLCLFHSTAMPDSDVKKLERSRIAAIVMNDHTQFISDLVPKLFAKENIILLKDEILKAQTIALKTPKEGIVAAILGMKIRPNRELVLKQAKYPVLFIIGKKDTTLAWENLLLLAALPKISTQLVLENAGHMGFYESPKECIKALKQFVIDCHKK